MIMVMIMRRSRSGFLRRSFEITAHIQNLFALIDATILAGGVRDKRSLAGGA